MVGDAHDADPRGGDASVWLPQRAPALLKHLSRHPQPLASAAKGHGFVKTTGSAVMLARGRSPHRRTPSSPRSSRGPKRFGRIDHQRHRPQHHKVRSQPYRVVPHGRVELLARRRRRGHLRQVHRAVSEFEPSPTPPVSIYRDNERRDVLVVRTSAPWGAPLRREDFLMPDPYTALARTRPPLLPTPDGDSREADGRDGTAAASSFARRRRSGCSRLCGA